MADATRDRIDRLLVAKGFFPSREKARRALEEGAVSVDGVVVVRPAESVRHDSLVELVQPVDPYVGRGGRKLEGAILAFGVDFRDRVVVDAGASTGGFTQCALLHGARFVHAIDVGHGQLDALLRGDARVLSREGTDIRSVRREDLEPAPDFLVADLSFISLVSVLPVLVLLLPPGGEAVLLLKPQFEAGRAAVGKGGIVRDPADHVRAIGSLLEALAVSRMPATGLAPSPIRGGDGNVEYLVAARSRPELTAGECRELSRKLLESAPSIVRVALDCS